MDKVIDVVGGNVLGAKELTQEVEIFEVDRVNCICSCIRHERLGSGVEI